MSIKVRQRFISTLIWVKAHMNQRGAAVPTDEQLDLLVSAMPEDWRNRWCEQEACKCTGCANGYGMLSFLGVTKERWARSVQDYRAGVAYREAMAGEKGD